MVQMLVGPSRYVAYYLSRYNGVVLSEEVVIFIYSHSLLVRASNNASLC